MRRPAKPPSNPGYEEVYMIDPLKFVKSSDVIGVIKRFAPQFVQNRIFAYSMERNKNLLKKAVLEYCGGGGDDWSIS
jgi:hypothetical protein